MGQSKGMARLKLAEQLITQRRRVTESTINEFEHVEINKLRTELSEEHNLTDLAKKQAAAQSKQYIEQGEIDAKRREELHQLEEEHMAEIAAVKAKIAAKMTKINEKYSAISTKSKEALAEAQEDYRKAHEKVETKLRERSVEINQKAAQMRTQLAHDSQTAIDKLYDAELSPELKAAIDSVPSIETLDSNSPRLSYKKQS